MSCFHSLEHFLYHIQSFKDQRSTFSYSFLTLWTSNFSKWPKLSTWGPTHPDKSAKLRTFGSRFSNSVKSGWKYTKFAIRIIKKIFFDPDPPCPLKPHYFFLMISVIPLIFSTMGQVPLPHNWLSWFSSQIDPRCWHFGPFEQTWWILTNSSSFRLFYIEQKHVQTNWFKHTRPYT